MRQFFLYLIFVCCFAGAKASYAQVCTGSLGAPVVNETFGTGPLIGPPLPAGVTTYKYVENACGAEDGEYAIASSMRSTSCKGGTWQSIQYDHTYYITGNPDGYMMIINASYAAGVFYTKRVNGNALCPNTTYEFSAYIMNILRDLPQTQGYTKPNITFNIEKPDGTLLKTYNTGDIPAVASPVWNKYSLFFTSPADGSDVIVKMINNGIGGNGNDLALDDITFSPCGPVIQAGFGMINGGTSKTSCVNQNLSYTLVASQTGYDNPSYQWQQNLNDGGWTDIAGQTTTTLPVTINNAAAGKYQYRIGVLRGSQSGSESCRIYSDPLTITVYPYPVPVVASSTSACVGFPLQLSSTGGGNGTYEWTGPNGYTGAGDSPMVTENADKDYNGVYTVKITTNGCPSFASTKVTVYDAPAINPISSNSICEGTSTQLTARGTNVTHYKWTPSTGLDHDDIANPVASPATTTTYTVEVSNDGCGNSQLTRATVTVWKKPLANAGANIKMFEGQVVKLNGTAQGDHISFYWAPALYMDNAASLTPNISPVQDITYTLHVISNEGCGESTSSVFVRVYKKLIVPNTFSPNGDGINDQWNITNLNSYPNAQVSVYNRYGQTVFQSRGYGTPWNGTYNNALLPTATYYYVIDPQEDDVPKLSGWVLIVK